MLRGVFDLHQVDDVHGAAGVLDQDVDGPVLARINQAHGHHVTLLFDVTNVCLSIGPSTFPLQKVLSQRNRSLPMEPPCFLWKMWPN